MKDTRNILLLVVSLCLVGTWIYHLYDKNRYSNIPAPVLQKDTVADQSRKNDSLRLAYNTVLSQLDSSRNEPDSAATTSVTESNAIDSLRNEITAILTINDITKEDLRRAEEKIKQLQQRLSVVTSATTPISAETKTVAASTSPAKTEAPVKKEPVNEVFAATSLSLRASDGKDQLTLKADATVSLTIGCVLQNSNTYFSDTEVYMVLTDPSGDVVQDDPWQSGMFTTGNDRIPYTRKAKLSYTKGEASRVAMNLKLQEYNKGLYAVQFYHNGVRIGRTTLRLN